jgi:superfamily II DNA/RNA helicase
MVEGNRGINNDVISKLHGIMRPFLLRRLKKDVEKQLPAKHEHIVMCKLSKRQQYLYEEYMSRTSTKSSLSGGNFLGMMNILMQLRKVCNHPDLFEPRPISSPFVAESVEVNPPKLVLSALDRFPLHVLSSTYLHLWPHHEDSIVSTAMTSYRVSEINFITIDDMNMQSSNRMINKPHYVNYLQQWKEMQRLRQEHKYRFNYHISNTRCTKPRLSMSWRTVQVVSISPLISDLAVMARTNHQLSRHLPLGLFDLVKTVADRANECDDMIRTFVFIIPKIVVNRPSASTNHINYRSTTITSCGSHIVHSISKLEVRQVYQQLQHALEPFYLSTMRQKIFFPERKLIQFDSGKLQTLSVLLQDLKRGGHKCLIFTQMSKMLDILEIFLNLHGHTYVRLDGSTNVDRRQKLMDRYNSDPKLFCFILSTRSGGLGINLTGADTVIFYDNDWNFAMDAQAQDRAHRIGQTREVHIYRFVSASTVEENILTKARQKRQLDFLVMTEGNFSEESLFTANNLQDMLGVKRSNSSISAAWPVANGGRPMDVEAAMAMVEDAEDVSALRTAEKEIEAEQAEFDESMPLRTTSEGEDDEVDTSNPTPVAAQSSSSSSSTSLVVMNSVVNDKEREEKDMEQEFASWQAAIGSDINALQKALRPVERYAFHLHTDIDPFYSIYYIQEQQRLANMADEERELAQQWDVDAIEREREEEEYRALSEGELLATNITREEVINLKSWFLGERSRLKRERRRRKMTGEAWELVIDPVTRVPFWYNDDTGAASYAVPEIIQQRELMETALARGFSSAPLPIAIHILSYLTPYPDRMNASLVCARWKEAAFDQVFNLRVLPVESGARDSKAPIRSTSGSKTYVSVDNALRDALPGDTVMLGAGHHWESSLIIDKPVRLIGDADDASRCILELTGEIYVSRDAKGVVLSTLSIRRPRKIPKRVSCITVNHASLEVSDFL